MPREASIQRSIERFLKRSGAWFVKYHGTATGRAGVPDLLVCFRGVFVAIEVKQPGGRTTARQDYELKKLAEAGAVTLVATSVTDVESLFATIG